MIIATVQSMGLIVGELADIPLEDFIKQINNMMRKNQFPERYPKELMAQFLMLSQGLLNLKSIILMNINVFDDFYNN